MKKFLVVGLGNIGNDYYNTRHNIGFMVLDEIAKSFNINFKSDKLALHTEFSHKGRKITLIKPSTFMNLSGKAVKYWANKNKIPLENILVITDDIALDFGIFRLRKKGSDGGHNGLKSINELLNTQNYPRFKFGIGKDFPKGRQVDYVLGEWTKEQTKILEVEKLEKAKELVISFALEGINIAMNKYNG